MAHTGRQLLVIRALIRSLLASGDYLLPEEGLRDNVDILVTPPPTRSETDEAMIWLDRNRLIVDGDTLSGRAWKLTSEGKAWAKENRIQEPR